MFNWAFIGCGNIACKAAKEITASGRHRIAAVYTRTFERGEAFTRRFGGKCYPDLGSALTDKAVDAVYIATPHSAHYANMLEAASYDKPVLCEKSFTVNLAQAAEVISLYESKNLYLAEAMWTRFNPVVRQVNEWVKSDSLGKIMSMSAAFCTPMSWVKGSIPGRVFNPETAGGSLLDLGVYPISYAQMLFGDVGEIECEMISEGGIDRSEKIRLQAGSIPCVLSASMDSLHSFTAVIRGEKGVIRVPMFYRPTHAAMKFDRGGREHTESAAGYIHQFDCVSREISSGLSQSRLIPHADTLEVMRVMDECRRQGSLKYPIEIEKTNL